MHFVTSLAQQGCLQFFVALSAWSTRASQKILLRGPREAARVLQRRLLSTRAGRELRIIWGRAQSQTLPEWREWVWRVRNWPCRGSRWPASPGGGARAFRSFPRTRGSPQSTRLSECGCPTSSPPGNSGTCRKCRVPGSTPTAEAQAQGVGPGGLQSPQPRKR